MHCICLFVMCRIYKSSCLPDLLLLMFHKTDLCMLCVVMWLCNKWLCLFFSKIDNVYNYIEICTIVILLTLLSHFGSQFIFFLALSYE